MPARKPDSAWVDVHRLYEDLSSHISAGWQVRFCSLPAPYPVLQVEVWRGDGYAASRSVYTMVQWMTVAELYRLAYRAALQLIADAPLS